MKVAVGWLGWSEEYALQANLNTIHLGFSGRLDMLKAIFGGGDDKGTAAPTTTLQEITPDMNLTTVPKDVHGKPITLTASLFDSLTFVKKANQHQRAVKHKPDKPIPGGSKSPSQRRLGKLQKKNDG